MQPAGFPNSPKGPCWFVSSLLFPGDFEVTLGRTLKPCAGDSSVGGADVFELALGCNVNRLAGLVFPVRFDANGPVRHIHEDASDRNGVGPRVDRSGNVLAVPVHDESQMSPLRWGCAPVARPCA